MPSETDNYWSATRHPWSCILFVVPLLAIYEVGIYALGNASPDEMRNGADVWLRSALSAVGVSPIYGAPLLLLAVLLGWGLIFRANRPSDKVGVWVGMTGESAAFALVLLALSQGLWHLLVRADGVLGQSSRRLALLQMTTCEPEWLWSQIVSYLGAGIYEETLFRLLLFAGLVRLFAWGETPSVWPITLAAFASAVLFAGAHHIGPNGDPFNAYVLSFRTFAGLYFAWLYQVRGFGVTVGAHAGYDVLVGIILQRE